MTRRPWRSMTRADPALAMAHWGRAYAIGPNYNMPWERRDANMLMDHYRRGARRIFADITGHTEDLMPTREVWPSKLRSP